MHASLSNRLRTVEVLQERTIGGLRIFDLRWQASGEPAYRTLDEALADGTLEVTEISQGGSVPQLKVVNRGDRPVFLMAGEQLVGAKQNRVLNTSILVPANAELIVPVSCVEAGRWGYVSPQFKSAGTMSHPKLRMMMSAQVSRHYKTEGYALSDQGEVWNEVSRKLGALGSSSRSAALQKSYEDHEARTREVLEQATPVAGCAGAAFAIGDKLVGLDLFDAPATLAKLWAKILRAYVLDRLEARDAQAPVLDRQEFERWLRNASEAKTEVFKSPGIGNDVRFDAEHVVGGALVAEDEPIHVELFAR